jgi:hypothetical protein
MSFSRQYFDLVNSYLFLSMPFFVVYFCRSHQYSDSGSDWANWYCLFCKCFLYIFCAMIPYAFVVNPAHEKQIYYSFSIWIHEICDLGGSCTFSGRACFSCCCDVRMEFVGVQISGNIQIWISCKFLFNNCCPETFVIVHIIFCSNCYSRPESGVANPAA